MLTIKDFGDKIEISTLRERGWSAISKPCKGGSISFGHYNCYDSPLFGEPMLIANSDLLPLFICLDGNIVHEIQGADSDQWLPMVFCFVFDVAVEEDKTIDLLTALLEHTQSGRRCWS